MSVVFCLMFFILLSLLYIFALFGPRKEQCSKFSLFFEASLIDPNFDRFSFIQIDSLPPLSRCFLLIHWVSKMLSPVFYREPIYFLSRYRTNDNTFGQSRLIENSLSQCNHSKQYLISSFIKLTWQEKIRIFLQTVILYRLFFGIASAHWIIIVLFVHQP